MPRNRKKKKSRQNHFRLLAWVLALAVALVSWNFAGSRVGLFLELTAALLFAVGTVWPHSFRSLYQVVVRPLGRLARRAWFF